MKLNWKNLVFGFLIFVVTIGVYGGESSTCLTVYKDEGAPAVFQSPNCPNWNLTSNGDAQQQRKTSNVDVRCQLATLQGRRKYMEDRTLCALDVRIPFRGREVTVDIVAIFDGHNGAEASEMASKLFLDYFLLHTHFLSDATGNILPSTVEERVPKWKEELRQQYQLNRERHISMLAYYDDSSHLEILKEALKRTIHDIDATFAKEALRNNIDAGSTAVVVLLIGGKILVANVGDSKALLCSKRSYQASEDARAGTLRSYSEQRSHFVAKELSRDHHPDRPDERLRIEASGGLVIHWGVPRVNGQLAVSRSIGDLPFKRYGVVPTPEVTNWTALTANDRYLVVSSDGIFETLSLRDVCDKLWEEQNHDTENLAESLINTAFEKGSMDNLAAFVVPLSSSSGISQDLLKDFCQDKEALLPIHEMYTRTGASEPPLRISCSTYIEVNSSKETSNSTSSYTEE